uniref:Uncharacterized protein n=1 Tax=Anopheles darlingi TaxID=43151 RepID=A0A2M4D803_ANODA
MLTTITHSSGSGWIRKALLLLLLLLLFGSIAMPTFCLRCLLENQITFGPDIPRFPSLSIYLSLSPCGSLKVVPFVGCTCCLLAIPVLFHFSLSSSLAKTDDVDERN